MKLQPWLLGAATLLLVSPVLSLNPLTQVSSRTRDQQPQVSETQDSHSNSVLQNQSDAATRSAHEVYQQVNPAVVTLYSEAEVGSGSLVSSEGLIITNRHVVQGLDVKVKTAAKTTYTGRVIAADLRNDLALVQLKTSDRFPTVRLADRLTLKSGDVVYAIGSPGGRAGTFTTGTFRRLTQWGSLQTSAGLLQPGNSGGPLLNDQGELIGINKGLLEDNSGLATSVLTVKQFMQRHRLAAKR